MANEKVDLNKLADKLGKDIAALDKRIADLKVPDNLKDIDLRSMLPSGAAGFLQEALSEVWKEVGTAVGEHESQLKEQKQVLEEAIDGRRQAMKKNAGDLKKEKGEAAGVAKILEKRISRDLKDTELRLKELRVNK